MSGSGGNTGNSSECLARVIKVGKEIAWTEEMYIRCAECEEEEDEWERDTWRVTAMDFDLGEGRSWYYTESEEQGKGWETSFTTEKTR